MQQAIYQNLTAQNTAKTVAPARHAGLTQQIARKWDLIGVLALMTSSTAYGLFALTHLA